MTEATRTININIYETKIHFLDLFFIKKNNKKRFYELHLYIACNTVYPSLRLVEPVTFLVSRFIFNCILSD